jgi:hypothetical protein
MMDHQIPRLLEYYLNWLGNGGRNVDGKFSESPIGI